MVQPSVACKQKQLRDRVHVQVGFHVAPFWLLLAEPKIDQVPLFFLCSPIATRQCLSQTLSLGTQSYLSGRGTATFRSLGVGDWSRGALHLVAPYRSILRYYRCDTPYCAILSQGGQHSPKMVRYPPPLVLSFTHAHLCDTPFCNVSRDNCAISHFKTSTKYFCDTIATSIARYEKYRCWASKAPHTAKINSPPTSPSQKRGRFINCPRTSL